MRRPSFALLAILLTACAAPAVAVPETEAPTASAIVAAPTAAPTVAAPTSDPTERPTLPPDLPTQCHATPFGPPDKACNPGLADPRVTQDTLATTICAPGYIARVSPPRAYLDELRAQQLQAYGFQGDPEKYTEDHILAVGLGGDPRDPRNLWPQTQDGLVADYKAEVETWARDEVCAGRRSLASVQSQMLLNWRVVYQAMLSSRPRGEAVPSPTIWLTITFTRSTYGAVTAMTRPGAQCVARILMPGEDRASSLQPTTADASGVVRWAYPAPFTTAFGTGKHTITCALQGETATNSAPFGVPADTAPPA